MKLDTSKITALEDFSGVVLVCRAGTPVFSWEGGLAHRGWNVPNTMTTRFRIASVSKMFTAVAVLQLVHQGLVHLDDPITKHLETIAGSVSDEVTIAHLLSMTSGIADWFDESGDWEADWARLVREHPLYLLRTDADYLPLFADAPPIAAPGERYAYNGAGYNLLGLLIERLGGTSYYDHVRRHVFDLAGMSRSDFVALDSVAPEVAEGYVPQTAGESVVGWVKNIYSTTPQAAADGGATSTAGDLVAFNRALRANLLLPADLTTQMLSPQATEREEQVRGYHWRYGYGATLLLDDDGDIVRWGHTGEEDGVSARLYHYPRGDVDVAVLGNHSWSAGDLGWQIHDALTS